MNDFIKKLLLIVLLYLVSGSCNTTNQESHTLIKFELNTILSSLEERINIQIPQHLHTISQRTKGPCINLLFTKACADIDSSGWVKRNGPITINGKGASLEVKIPIHANIKARGTGEIGKHIRETATASMVITAILYPTIKDDWSVDVKVSTSFHWTERPNIVIAGVRITFENQVNSSINTALKNATVDLQREISKKLLIKPQVKEAWDKLSTDLLVDQATNTWLKIRPVDVYVSPFRLTTNEANIAIELKARTELLTNYTPNPKKEMIALPNLSPNSFGKGKIRIPVLVDTKSIMDVINAELENSSQSFKVIRFDLSDDVAEKSRVRIKIALKSDSWLTALFEDEVTFSFSATYKLADNKLSFSNIIPDDCKGINLSCALKNWLILKSNASNILETDFTKDVSDMKGQIVEALNKFKTDLIKQDIDLNIDIGDITLTELEFPNNQASLMIGLPLEFQLSLNGNNK